MATDMEFGAFDTSEVALAGPLIARLPNDSLTLVDRGFHSYKLVHDVTKGGSNRHLLARLRKNIEVEVIELLPDGTERVRIHPNKSLRRTNPEFTEPQEGRVITYQHPGGEPSRLFTTLTDGAHRSRRARATAHRRSTGSSSHPRTSGAGRRGTARTESRPLRGGRIRR